MSKITGIYAKEILDSRGKPTIEVTVVAGEYSGSFSVPSGASTGSTEAFVLHDPDGHMRSAIESVERIRAALIGTEISAQREIDGQLLSLDGTEGKTRLGGNVILGISVAAARAAAEERGMQLFAYLRTCAQITPSRTTPLLYMNYINGGKHVNPQETSIAFQEHMIVPQTDSVSEALSIARSIEEELSRTIREIYGSDVATRMGDEGGYVIPESDVRAPFTLLKRVIERTHNEGKVLIAIDAAANSFYADGTYTLGGTMSLTSETLAELYRTLIQEFPILSIEDPFAEGAFDAFSRLQKSVSVKIVGDDITTTSAARITAAAQQGAIRAVIIKPNQIGTLSETLTAMQTAREAGIDCIVSHRSGETSDTFIADLSYAFGAFGIKAGALRRAERVVKYERLQEITSM